MTSLRILIAGGGIAGLATKLALAAANIETDLVERYAAPPDGGSGLYLPANAVRALADLGLREELGRRSVPITRQEIRDRTGTLLTAFDLSEVWGDSGECLAIRRQDLHALLQSAAGSAGTRSGVGVREARADGTVIFSDDSRAQYDVVVGADGIDSTVRRSVFPQTQKRFLRQVCWRFVAPAQSVREATWSALLGSHGRTVLMEPLGRGEVYCFAAINSSTPHPPGGDWRDLFSDFAPAATQILEKGTGAYFAPLYEIPGSDWVNGRIVLVGDAAHACSPSMAQGGAMALEDALVLAAELAGALGGAGEDAVDVPEALSRYRSRRVERVAFVLAENHRRDLARNLPGFVRKQLFRRAGVKIVRANHARLLTRP